MAQYEIESADENVKKFPGAYRKFYKAVPSAEKIAALDVGQIVKIVFRSPGCPSERMWVRVVGFKDKRIVGVLDNVPLCIPVDLGDLVTFGEGDIVDVYGASATTTALLFLVGAAAVGFMGWAIYRSVSPMVVEPPAPLPPGAVL